MTGAVQDDDGGVIKAVVERWGNQTDEIAE